MSVRPYIGEPDCNCFFPFTVMIQSRLPTCINIKDESKHFWDIFHQLMLWLHGLLPTCFAEGSTPLEPFLLCDTSVVKVPIAIDRQNLVSA